MAVWRNLLKSKPNLKNIKISKGSILIAGFFFLMFISRRWREEIANEMVYMEGMEHLYAENKYGYYFGVYSEMSKDRDRDGVIDIEKSSDNLYIMVESAGQERKIAIQIFIDYIQVPILVDGKEYFTYMIDADDRFSEEFCFQLSNEIDESVNHKMVAAMTIFADINEVNTMEERTSDRYSLAYDLILRFSGNDEKDLGTNKLYDYEEPRDIYQAMWEGLIINSDLEEFKRKFPEKSIEAKPGEKIKLQYHVGGFKGSQEALIILSLGMEQIQVNSQNYLICNLGDEEIYNGILEINAPDEAGLYDLTGWVIKNPFSESEIEHFPLSATPRFTINVHE